MIDETPTVQSEIPAAPRQKAGPILLALLAIAAISAIFLAFPDIDLWASGAFYAPGHGFTLAVNRTLVAFRNSADVLVAVAVIVLLASVGIKLARPGRQSPIAPGKVLFLLW